jgi:hypothetical protein
MSSAQPGPAPDVVRRRELSALVTQAIGNVHRITPPSGA